MQFLSTWPYTAISVIMRSKLTIFKENKQTNFSDLQVISYLHFEEVVIYMQVFLLTIFEPSPSSIISRLSQRYLCLVETIKVKFKKITTNKVLKVSALSQFRDSYFSLLL